MQLWIKWWLICQSKTGHSFSIWLWIYLENVLAQNVLDERETKLANIYILALFDPNGMC